MVDCTGLENRRTERYRGFESLPLRKKSGTTKVVPDFVLYEWKAHLPTKYKTKSVTNTARWLLISCQGTPTRDGRAKRSQFRPQNRQKTKSVTNTARCLLISCQGAPTRDGRAKRSQFRPQNRQKRKSVTNTARCLLISCQGTPTRDGRVKRSQFLPKRKTYKDT